MGTEKKVKATDLLDRPIAFHRCFVTITGTVGAALMLSQAVYWSKRTKDDGWFYKTQEDWTEETGLTRGEQEEARKRLKSYGYLEEKRRGMPARLYYRVNEEAINKALAGEIKELSLSEILENFSTALTNLSRAGLMRAQKLNVEREFVDYQLVLEAHGAVCHLCKAPINFGPGQKATDMAFDHVLPLNAGGSHTFNNIRPSHVICNARKGDDASLSTVDSQDCLHKTDKPAYSKRTRLSTESRQDGLSKADYKGTETTTETTSETTSLPPSAQRKPNPFYEAFAERYQQAYGCPYQNKKQDFVQLAKCREQNGEWLTTDRWLTALGNYFASPQGNHTLADFSSRFGAFFRSALDRYGKPVATVSTGLSQKTQGNLAAAKAFLARYGLTMEDAA